jgi:signal transduction histidine kinase
MKIICILLLLFVSCTIITGCHLKESGTVPERTEQKATKISDSLSILDTLVQETRINNNRLSLAYAKRALKLAEQSGKPEDLVLANIIIGTSFNTNDKDSSYYYFNLAIKIAEQPALIKLKVRILYNLAMFYIQAYDDKTALRLLDSTIRLSDNAKDYNLMADAYNALGTIRSAFHDSTAAEQMYQTSFTIAKTHSLYRQMGIALGNLAKDKSDTKTSINLQNEAIGYLKKAKGMDEQIATIFINIGLRYLTMPDSAISYYRNALKYAKNGNLPKIEIGAYNNMAYSYLDAKNISAAETCILHGIQLAREQKDNDWLSTLYDSYGDILINKENYKEAVIWQKKAIEARDIAAKTQASEQVRLLGTLFDVRNKELIIQNTETELLLQKNRLQQTRLWLALSVLLVFGSVLAFLAFMQRTRMKLQLQQITSARRLIEMEESEKGRTARELHDITGQLIMGITGAVEKLDLPDDRNKAEIQGKIKDLGRSIRTISHRMNKAMLEHFTFKELVTGQCEDIQKLTGMRVQLDMPEGNYNLEEEMVLHTYRIVQELLTNASKYVPDSTVRISFINSGDKLLMTYEDNGKGFDLDGLKKPGMGIMNIFERSKLLGGKAKLTSSPGNGTKWEIFIPLNIRKRNPPKKVEV